MDKLTKIYNNVFGNLDGKIVLGDILKFCHLMHSTYGKNVDPYNIMFAAGERNVGFYILNKLKKNSLDMYQLNNELENILKNRSIGGENKYE